MTVFSLPPEMIFKSRRAMVESANKELFYDSIADQWDSFINKAETEKRLRVVFGQLFDSSDLVGRSFPDVGCGLGFFPRRALECGAVLTSVDIGENLVRVAGS